MNFKTVTFKTSDRYELLADFYPANKAKAGLVIYIHGGGLLFGNRQEIDKSFIKILSEKGFAIFSLDYRLAPQTKLEDIREDITAAIDWLKKYGEEELGVDSTKIALLGTSAGGFLALQAGLKHSDLRGIVSLYGYGDITGSWALSPSEFYLKKPKITKDVAASFITGNVITGARVNERYLLYLYARQSGKWVEMITGLNPSANLERLKELSPIYNLGKDYPPTLLIHGTEDTDVPYEQSVLMRKALAEKAIEVELVSLQGADHQFEKDLDNPDVVEALEKICEFFEQKFS